MLTKLKAKTPLATLALAVAITVAIAFAAGNQIAFHQFNSLATRQDATWDIRVKLTQILSLLTDIETGGRGYALTGKDEFLEPLTAANDKLAPLYDQLKQLAIDTNGLKQSWIELDALIEHRSALSNRLVEERRVRGKAILEDESLPILGKQTMDKARLVISHIDTKLAERIASLSTDRTQLRHRITWLGWFSMLSIATLITSAGYLLSLERSARRILNQGLRDMNSSLEQRVSERTEELIAAKSRLAAFAVEQEQSIEAERKRLSREVHDQIGATFAGLKLILQGLPAGCIPDYEARALLMAVDMGVNTARRIATELRPPLLDDLGLQAALQQLLDTTFRAGDLQGSVELHDEDTLSQNQMIGLFRIVQEAVSNVVRHANASHFAITGAVDGDDGYCLNMADNGIGLAAIQPRQGALGLAGMRERTELMRGHITIENGPAGGASITILVPIEHRLKELDHENSAT